MLHGEHVTLRAIERDDLPVLHELLDDDLELMARASDTPARPASLAELEHRFEERLEESARRPRHRSPAGTPNESRSTLSEPPSAPWRKPSSRSACRCLVFVHGQSAAMRSPATNARG